jgi:nitroreductase
MDAFLTIVSKRDTRQFAPAGVPAEARQRILEAGRLAGSARNRQPWRFVVVETDEAKARVAETLYVPDNLTGASFGVAIVGPSGIDTGRCAQNMMLAAWSDGVASCPNGTPDPARTAAALGLDETEQAAVVLSFGYPATGHTAEKRPADEWIARADRKPLDELVTKL